MLIWNESTDQLPDWFCCGDRIIGVVCERRDIDSKLVDSLLILELTETGWLAADDRYVGYSISDCSRWITERDILNTSIGRRIQI